MGDKINISEISEFEQVPLPTSIAAVSFVLELHGIDEEGNVDATITLSGFETPEKINVLKEMLTEIVNNL